jgi:hypothetical protein
MTSHRDDMGEQGLTADEKELISTRNRVTELERTLACYRAARVTWPPHVLEAIARGDVEACAADARARHANWEALHAERDLAATRHEENGRQLLALEAELAKVTAELKARYAAEVDALNHIRAEHAAELAKTTAYVSADGGWARRMVLAELDELLLVGYAANVQTWASYGVKSNVELCKARRAEARRLLRLAAKAVRHG